MSAQPKPVNVTPKPKANTPPKPSIVVSSSQQIITNPKNQPIKINPVSDSEFLWCVLVPFWALFRMFHYINANEFENAMTAAKAMLLNFVLIGILGLIV